VHRVAASHRRRLVGRRFKATSPNGRFAAGAAAIDGKKFTDCQVRVPGRSAGSPCTQTATPFAVYRFSQET
jgi:hypothetical protein